LSAEHSLINQSISHKLEYTNVVLFKAIQNLDEKMDMKYNNVDKVIADIESLKLIPISADHRTIINERNVLIDNIANI